MQGFILSILQKHTPPVISILLAICAGTFYISQAVNDGFTAIKADLIADAREPVYAVLLSSLDKQLEKLDSDNKDLKTADIKLLYNQCNGDFGKLYLPTLPPGDMLAAKMTCSMLEKLYLERRPF